MYKNDESRKETGSMKVRLFLELW